MKYVILIGDGMGDYPIEQLGGKTAIEAANTPNLDWLAQTGLLARASTIPQGMPPGSDVAIMSLLGYNPKGVLTGRGPLEAAALKIKLQKNDLAFRLNLVTLEWGNQTIIRDHSAGDISNPEAYELLESLKKEMPLSPGQSIHQGVTYRNCFIWPDAPEGLASIPPHDHLDHEIDHFLNNPDLAPIMNLVKASWKILKDHPINQKRIANNQPPANSIWLWGQGRAPRVKSYHERWGITGATVSAVDIIRGLAISTGLEPLSVEGATGALDTNYTGKVAAGLTALKNHDLAVIHLEAPDEMSHQGNLKNKLLAIEAFDAKIVGPVLEGLKIYDDYRILVSCDHFTPVSLKTHTSDPVPFIMYDKKNPASSKLNYSEANALATGLLIEDGPSLGHLLFGQELS